MRLSAHKSAALAQEVEMGRVCGQGLGFERVGSVSFINLILRY